MSRSPQHLTEKKSELAESIIDAAERLLNSYGYQKMTMTDLAAEAGIGVGTTYLHFASKADVAVAVVNRLHGRVYSGLEEIASFNIGPGQKIAEMLWFRVRFPYEFVREKLTRMSWQQVSRHGTEFMDDVRSSNPTAVEEWKRREAALVASVIADGILTKAFTDVDSAETAATLLTATCGFMPRNLDVTDYNNADDFEKRVKGVIRLLVGGILIDKSLESWTGTN